MPKKIMLFVLLSIVMTSSAMAYTHAKVAPTKVRCREIHDPLEKYNRMIFRLNYRLDKAFIRPLARGYQKITPTPIRKGVKNFLNNLLAPLSALNYLLQGDVDSAVKTSFSFLINSSFGVLGVNDLSKELGLETRKQNFDATFAHYGAGYGAYIMLPILGPSTTRNLFGRVFDVGFDPVDDYASSKFLMITRTANSFVKRSELVETTDEIERTSLDNYAKVRSMYIQYAAGLNPSCQNQEVNYDDYEY